jgi:hypothetical protein
MKLFGTTSSAAPPLIGQAQFREVLRRANVVREFFLPADRARWVGRRYTLGRWATRAFRPHNTGVRLQEPYASGPGQTPEVDTQHDLGKLIESVAELRKVPELAGVVLSRETLVGNQQGTMPGKRIQFGLNCPADGRYLDEKAAARECYRALRWGLFRAFYAVEHPTTGFDPSTGLAGLAAWARTVLLRRRQIPRRWFLVLIPLLFVGLGVKGCLPNPATWFGVAIDTDSLIVLYDKSDSMGPYLAQVRDESRKLLEERSQRSGEQFADLIAYDNEAASALDGIRPVTAESIKKITGFMNSLRPGGWTNLAAGMDLAAEEVSRHGRKTTLLVFTDGEDKSIPEMLKDKNKVLAKFKGVSLTVHAVTPRLLKPGADPRPITTDEKTLRDFCKAFNGQFGPTKGGQ